MNKLAAFIAAHALLTIALGISVALLWSSRTAARRSQEQLTAQLQAKNADVAGAQKQIEQIRSTEEQNVAAIEADLTAAKSSAQAMRALPKYLPLPVAAAPEIGALSSEPPTTPALEAAQLAQAPIEVPAGEAKPLLDFAARCDECKLSLDAAEKQMALKDEQIAALQAEERAAAKAAKGGGFWAHLRSSLHWFAIGAGAGAAALCASGHCR